MTTRPTMNAKSRVCLRIAVPHGVGPSAGPVAPRPSRFGMLLRVAGDVGLVRRALAREARAGAERLGDRVAEQRADGSCVAVPERDGLVAAAGLEAHVVAVAVEVLALAGEADHRVPELLVVLLVRGERAVLDLDVAGRQHDLGQALRRRGRPAGTGRRSRRSTLREVARRRAELVQQALQLGRAERARAPARSTGTRRRSSPAVSRTPGQDVAGERARVREARR